MLYFYVYIRVKFFVVNTKFCIDALKTIFYVILHLQTLPVCNVNMNVSGSVNRLSPLNIHCYQLNGPNIRYYVGIGMRVNRY